MEANLLWTMITFVIAAVGTLALGMVFKYVDRKVTALVQWRVGPPWYQPLVDVLKLMGKETLVPSTARRTGFLLAPVIALSATALSALILWRALLYPDQAFVGDLIVVVYLLLVPALMTIYGGLASGSSYAAVGAAREMKLVFSYELPLLLALLVAVAHTGWSLKLGEIIKAQHAAGPVAWSISGALALIVGIICMQAKLGQVPFDLAEAECEIMSGAYVEYSGPALGMWMMTRAMLLAVVPLLLIIVFWGGVYTAAWWGWLTFAGKYLLLVALVTLIRNTNPRLRIDQAVKFFWFSLTPAAIVTIILALIGIFRSMTWL